LAAADVPDGDILFYRIEFKQHASPSRRAPRPAVEVVGGAIMTYEQCAEWLLELSFNFSAGSHCTVLSRPSQSRPKQIRVAWIGPEILEGVAMPARLRAIGEVYGADIVHIPPRSYRDVSARLREALPLESVIICNHFAPYIESRIVPDSVRPNLVHICGSIARADLEHQIHTWVELAAYEIERQCYNKAVDENHGLLKIMLRGMLSHSKIGQFNHCDKATVLTSVRGRRMNVPLAEEILNRNSEAFEDTSISEALFLSKEHNDGRRYFLNPSQMDRIRIIAGLSGASTR
jgi:hypothetical protein